MTLLVGDVTEGDGDEDDDNHAHADAHVDDLVVDAAVGLSWGKGGRILSEIIAKR